MSLVFRKYISVTVAIVSADKIFKTINQANKKITSSTFCMRDKIMWLNTLRPAIKLLHVILKALNMRTYK